MTFGDDPRAHGPLNPLCPECGRRTKKHPKGWRCDQGFDICGHGAIIWAELPPSLSMGHTEPAPAAKKP